MWKVLYSYELAAMAMMTMVAMGAVVTYFLKCEIKYIQNLPSTLIHYFALVDQSGMQRKHVYRYDHTTSRMQLIYDEGNCEFAIVNPFLRPCLSDYTNNFHSVFIAD